MVEIHWHTLKFSSRVSENGYLHSVADDVIKGFRVGCILSTSVASCFVVSALLVDTPNRVWFLVGQVLFFAILGVCSLVSGIVRLIPLHIREVVVVCLLMFYMLVFVYSQPYYEHRIRMLFDIQFDTGTYDESKHATDSQLLLEFCVCIAAVHLFIPVRWIVMLPLDVFCVLVYGFAAFVLKSPEYSPPFQLLMLALNVFFSCLGKRRMEISLRLAFLNVAVERALRAEAEFKTSKVQMVGLAEAETRTDSEHATEVTTASAKAVQRLYEQDTDIAAILEQIINLGNQEHWVVQPEDLKILPDRILGNGSFGTVLVGRLHGTEVAVKLTQRVRRQSQLTHTLRELVNELRVLRHVRHTNVAYFYGASFDISTGSVALIMELVTGISLLQYINGRPTRHDRHHVSLQLARALHFLHSLRPPVIHGDVKPENVVVEVDVQRPKAKMVDFGLSRVLHKHVRKLGGSLQWMAPEVVQGASHGCETCADTYSFGLVFYFVQTGRHPFSGRSKSSIRVVQCSGVDIDLPWPDDCEDYKELCAQCVKADPTSRLSMVHVHEQIQRYVLGDAVVEASSNGVVWDWANSQSSSELCLPRSVSGVFDAVRPDCPILGANYAWVRVFGQSETLMEILGDTYGPFTEWLQTSMNTLFYSADDGDKLVAFGKVKCKHVSGRSFEATLAVRILSEMLKGDNSRNDPAMGTQLIFLDPCWIGQTGDAKIESCVTSATSDVNAESSPPLLETSREHVMTL